MYVCACVCTRSCLSSFLLFFLFSFLKKWVDVKLPSCAVTCHALFSYGSHLYMCASSSDKTDRRSKARGDVVWRLEDNGGDWTRVTQMPHVQWHYGAALDGSRVIFAGGWNGKGEVSHVVVYDLNLGKWLDQLSPLPVPSFGAQSFVTNECFYFVGGSTRHSDLGEVFYLHLSPHSPSYNQWRSIHNPQATCGSCLVNHKIVTIGGWDNSLKQAYNTVHLFDADNSEWLMLPSLRVCVCVCVCVRACACARACTCVCVHLRTCVRPCMLHVVVVSAVLRIAASLPCQIT